MRLMKTYAVSVVDEVNEIDSSVSRPALLLEARISGAPLPSPTPAYKYKSRSAVLGTLNFS